MNRRSFGFWGVDLSTADFAAALAAAGVLAGNEPLEDAERERGLLVWRSPLERLGLLRDAREYAAKWKQYIATKDVRERPRIEIDPEFDSRRIVDAMWVLETLSIPEVQAAAVYIRAEEPVAKVVLEWPIRIGVLPSATASSLLAELRGYHHHKLIKLVTLSEKRRECDVLLLPGSLKQSVAELAALPFNMRCDVAIVLGASDATPRNATALIATIRSLSRSAGVAVTPTTGNKLPWFWRFIDEIAHNNSIDVALSLAVQPKSSVTFVASRLLAQWSLSRRIDLLREKIEEHAESIHPIVLSSQSAEMLGLNKIEFEREVVPMYFPGPCRTNLRNMGKRLEQSHALPWNHEIDMATASVELQEITAEVLSDAPAAPEPRWIQAQVYAQRADTSPVRVTDAFRPNAPHEVRVRVARADAEWIRGEHLFPPLPDDESEHLLTVIFFERQCMTEPQTGTILLPRRGDSSSVSFFFKPGNAQSIEARITVLYQNRVLQTALLKGVLEYNGTADARIEVVTEAVVRPGMYGLAEMERGDAAIVLNESVTGESGALKSGGGRASYVSLEDIKSEIAWFDDRLSDIAYAPPGAYDGLFAADTVKMLVAFAEHGVLLHQHLTDSKDFEKLSEAERIQVVSAKAEARFPIEFVYDRDVEVGVSSLCLHAEQALRTGKCEDDVPPGALPGSVICPLGFWGLRKVIERHVYDRDIVWPAGAEFSLQSIPIDGRKRLDILKSAVLGATTRVDAVESGGIERVRTALNTIYGSSSYALEKWTDWTTVVGHAPTLLVLLIHVEEADKLQLMEIGNGELLGAAQLVTKLKQQSLTTPPALVLLMGCETGAPNLSYQGFVAQFRRGGAAAVISSGSTLLGRHVVPITEELLKQLKTLSAGDKTSIGEGMRAIRRTMLADGLPMVLALTAYGDADWRLA